MNFLRVTRRRLQLALAVQRIVAPGERQRRHLVIMKTFPLLRSGICAFLGALPLAGADAIPAAATEHNYVRIEGKDLRAIGFDVLSQFKYTIYDAGSGASADEIKAAMNRDQVPAWIRVLDHERVALTGYMMPLTFENGLSTKFIMMKDLNTCCYGAVPSMNDYVIVTMKDKGISPVQDIPVRLVGTFRIDQKYEGDYLVSLFVMDGEKFFGPLK